MLVLDRSDWVEDEDDASTDGVGDDVMALRRVSVLEGPSTVVAALSCSPHALTGPPVITRLTTPQLRASKLPFLCHVRNGIRRSAGFKTDSLCYRLIVMWYSCGRK